MQPLIMWLRSKTISLSHLISICMPASHLRHHRNMRYFTFQHTELKLKLKREIQPNPRSNNSLSRKVFSKRYFIRLSFQSLKGFATKEYTNSTLFLLSCLRSRFRFFLSDFAWNTFLSKNRKGNASANANPNTKTSFCIFLTCVAHPFHFFCHVCELFVYRITLTQWRNKNQTKKKLIQLALNYKYRRKVKR